MSSALKTLTFPYNSANHRTGYSKLGVLQPSTLAQTQKRGDHFPRKLDPMEQDRSPTHFSVCTPTEPLVADDGTADDGGLEVESNHTPMSRDAGGDAARRDFPSGPAAAPVPAQAHAAQPECSADSGSEDMQPLDPKPGTILVFSPSSDQKASLYLPKKFFQEEFLPALGLRAGSDPLPFLEVETCERDGDDLIVLSKLVECAKPVNRLAVSGAHIPARRPERGVPLVRKGKQVQLTYLGRREDPDGGEPIHHVRLLVPPASQEASDSEEGNEKEEGEDEEDDEVGNEEEEEEEIDVAAAVAAAAARGAPLYRCELLYAIPHAMPEGTAIVKLGHEAAAEFLAVLESGDLVGTALELRCRRLGLGPRLVCVEAAKGYAGKIKVGSEFREGLGLDRGSLMRFTRTGQCLGEDNKTPVFCFNLDVEGDGSDSAEEEEEDGDAEPAGEEQAAAGDDGGAAAAAEAGPGNGDAGAPGAAQMDRMLCYKITDDPRKPLRFSEEFLRHKVLPLLELPSSTDEGVGLLPYPVKLELQLRGQPAVKGVSCQISSCKSETGAAGELTLPSALLEALPLQRGDTIQLEYPYNSFAPTNKALSEWHYVYTLILDRVPAAAAGAAGARADAAPAPAARTAAATNDAPAPAVATAADAPAAAVPSDRPGHVMRYHVTSDPEKLVYLKHEFLRKELLPTLGIAVPAPGVEVLLPQPLKLSLTCKGLSDLVTLDCTVSRTGKPPGKAGKLCLPAQLRELLQFKQGNVLVLEYQKRTPRETATKTSFYVYGLAVDREPGPGGEPQTPGPAAATASAAAAPAPRAAATADGGPVALATATPAAVAAAAPAARKRAAAEGREADARKAIKKLTGKQSSAGPGAKRPAPPARPPAPATAKRAKAGSVDAGNTLRPRVAEAAGPTVRQPGVGPSESPTVGTSAGAGTSDVGAPPKGLQMARRSAQPMENKASPARPQKTPSKPPPPPPLYQRSAAAPSHDPPQTTLTTPVSKLPAPRRLVSSADPKPAARAAPGAGPGGSAGAGGSTLFSSGQIAIKQEPGTSGVTVSKNDWRRAALGCRESLDHALQRMSMYLPDDGTSDDDCEQLQLIRQQAAAHYSRIFKGLPAEYESEDIIRASGAALPRHSLCRGIELPWMEDHHFERMSMFATAPDEKTKTVLRGKAPFRLWVGPVDGASGPQGVVALEDIPAGSWVLPVVGEYVFCMDELSPLVLDVAADGKDGCVMPRTAVATAAQATMFHAAEASKRPGWRRLAGAALDCRRHGGAASLLRKSSDPNLGKVAVDLMTGPSALFYFATRDIVKGEELTRY